jgi:hypothetical protein
MRRDTLTSLQTLSTTYPEMVNRVARDALVAYISKASTPTKVVASAGDDVADDKSAANRQSRLSAFLYTCAAFDEATDVAVKQRLLADLLIIAHHGDICTSHARPTAQLNDILLCRRERSLYLD